MYDKMQREFLRYLRDPAKLQRRAIDELARAVSSGRLIAFTGSYATQELGYPGWHKFLKVGFPKQDKSEQEKLKKEYPWIYRAFKSSLKKDSPTRLADYEIALAYLESGNRDLVERRRERLAKDVGPAKVDGPQAADLSAMDELIDRLGIKRIVTLNYDTEAEYSLLANASDRLLPRAEAMTRIKNREDKAIFGSLIEHDSSHRWSIETAEGTHIVSDTFSRERTDRLFEFAIGSSFHDGHVMHLHGRHDVALSMVVTYGDYEQRYRRSSLTKLPFEHALRTLFSGNPIIFIGTGQSEEELLGHLRQFVSDGRRSSLAPIFAIWSPMDSSGNVINRKADDVSPSDNLKRLRWFREFGIYTIFDTELTGFSSSRDHPPEARIRQSITLLPAEIGIRLRLGRFEHEHFRSVSGFYANLDAEGIPRSGAVIWGVDEAARSDFPNWDLPDTNDDPYRPGQKAETSRSDPDAYLCHLIDFGAPIKAVLDIPGSGHGYLARLIREMVIDRQARHAMSSTTNKATAPCIVAQINAGFAWEIDTTFELISGLYDCEPAFGAAEGAQISRAQALENYMLKLEEGLAHAKGNGDQSKIRRIVILINGSDRFFDQNGYPLSADLDNLLRRIQLFQDKFLKSTDGKMPNPISLFLFGTGRVGRYLEGLRLKVSGPDSDNSMIEYLGDLQQPFQGERNRHREISSLNPLTFIDRRLDEFIDAELDKDLTTLENAFPLILPHQRHAIPQYFRSAYLRATEKRIKAELGVVGFADLPGAHRFAMDRARGLGPRRQREAFFDAYINTHVLAQILEGGTLTIKAQRAELALAILETMAFLGQPVEVSTLCWCPKVRDATNACIPVDRYEEWLGERLAELARLNLISEMADYPGNTQSKTSKHDTGKRYGLHRALLHEIRDRHTVPLSDARTYTSFNIPLFAAQPIDESEPEERVYQDLERLIRRLIERGPEIENGPSSYRHGMRLRAAMASLRSYYTTSALLMHEPPREPSEEPSTRLTDHARLLERLIRAFGRNAEERTKSDVEVAAGKGNVDAIALSKKPKVLFADDLIWLHDQRGVALLAQGNLYESRQAFREAQRINAKFVEPGNGYTQTEFHGQNWRRITLNQLHLDIERGKLDEAEDKSRALEQSINAVCEGVQWKLAFTRGRPEFASAEATAFEVIIGEYGSNTRAKLRVADPVFPADAILTTGLVACYRGWSAMFAGKFRTAEHYLQKSIQIFLNIGEQRAYANSLRLYASLQRAMGKSNEARDSIKLCLAAADSGRQMDISHHAWIMDAELELDCEEKVDRTRILHQFQASLRYATLSDMYRVQMEARRALAKLKYDEGDYDGALEQASEALSVAIRCGFSLRKISMRILIGEILFRRGDRVSGSSMLDQAMKEADRTNNQRAVEQVHSTRMRLQI